MAWLNGLARSALVSALLSIAVAFPAGSVSAQVFQGRILDEDNDAPVVTALVRLVDESGVQHAVTAADSSGSYVIEAPAPGVYRLEAARLGYENMETPLLEAGDPEGVYPLDLMLRKSPLPIRGLDIRVTNEEADRQVRLMVGVSIASLRKAPIRHDEIQDALDKGRDLASLLRWQAISSMNVFRTVDGPCFTIRRSGCLPVYFNGMHYRQEILDVVPLDMVHTIVVLYPGESIAYLGGAILLYSEAWLR
jgi:carboxypeptidase family protein